MRTTVIISMLISVFALQGCATILHGSHQDIDINTTPPGIKATIGTRTCITPCTLTVSRHVRWLSIEKPGIARQEYRLEKSVNLFSYYFGNIFWLIFPGMIIDSSTGAKYTIAPVNITMEVANY